MSKLDSEPIHPTDKIPNIHRIGSGHLDGLDQVWSDEGAHSKILQIVLTR